MPTAPVPKTPVDEDGKTRTAEDEIRAARQGLVSAPTRDPGPMQYRGELHFSVLVATRADGAHNLAAFCPCEHIGHCRTVAYCSSGVIRRGRRNSLVPRYEKREITGDTFAMKTLPGIALEQVQNVYSGAEGRLWELLMGEQIHIGGFASSMDLAERGGIGAGQSGVDLCCATGAGMRFLVRFRGVSHMHGVDATPAMVTLGRQRAEQEGLTDRITFVQENVCSTGLPAGRADFVWGEDAWCYVADKAGLVTEAARLVKSGGRIAFTDWVEGPAELSAAEAARYMGFMKFPSILKLEEYRSLLCSTGFRVVASRDTGRFAAHMPLYLDMIQRQLTYDALKIIGFDTALAEKLIGEMRFLESLAQAGKISQGLVVAEKVG